MTSERECQDNRRRKLYLICDEIGLSRSERIEFSQYLLRRDITTWKTLSDAQVGRLLDGLEGFQLVSELLSQRPNAQNEDLIQQAT
jgi:hypothetical protein